MAEFTIPDFSEYQGAVDWRTLVAAGYPAAIIRAHNGTRPDLQWAANRAGAHAAGITALGLYQYLAADVDAVTQANEFCDLVGALRPGEWPICDLEVGSGDQSARAHAWFATVAGRLHDGPAEELYSDASFWAEHNLSGGGFARGWVAAYGSAEPGIRHDLWQFSEARTFPGVSTPCDANLFHGSIDDLLTLANGDTDVPMTAADANLFVTTLLDHALPDAGIKNPDGTPATRTVADFFEYLDIHNKQVQAQNAALTKQVAALSAQVTALSAALAAVAKGETAVVEAAVAAALKAAGHVVTA